MLDIYICEDNEEQLAFVSAFVSDYCEMGNLDACIALASKSPMEILKHYECGNNPALFILDIDLKSEMDGIELACRVRENDKTDKKRFIVFLTTHSEMTLLTFKYKVEALDFIIKDNAGSIKRKLGECIDVALKRHIANGNTKTLRITVDDKIVFMDMDEIISIETTHVRHKLRLHTKNRAIEFNSELKAIGERLDGRFIRCHKSYIINKDKIAAINKNEKTVTMVNNNVCYISRSWKKHLTPMSGEFFQV